MPRSLIGDPNSFAFEIVAEGDPFTELMEVVLLVSTRRIGGRGPVYLPTFVSEIEAFRKCHESDIPRTDFSSLTDEDAFTLLHTVGEGDVEVGGVQPRDVWDYHRLYNLDDAVDGWDIFVFDVVGDKHIVCKEVGVQDGSTSNDVFSAVVPRTKFLAILDEVVEFLVLSSNRGTEGQSPQSPD